MARTKLSARGGNEVSLPVSSTDLSLPLPVENEVPLIPLVNPTPENPPVWVAPPKDAPKTKRYRVLEDGRVNHRGCLSFIRKDTIIDEMHFDVELIRQMLPLELVE